MSFPCLSSPGVMTTMNLEFIILTHVSLNIYLKTVLSVFLFSNIMYMVCNSVQYFISLGQSLKTEKFYVKLGFLAFLETTRRSGNVRLAFWRGSVPSWAGAVLCAAAPQLPLWGHMHLHLDCVSFYAGLVPDSELPSILILFFLQSHFCCALLIA